MTTPSALPPLAFATTGELLLSRAGDDGTALLFEDEAWSWRELVREAGVRARLLEELRPGADRPWHVGVLSDNTPEYLFLIAGAALAGATVVGVNPTRRGQHLADDVRHTDCDTVLVEGQHQELLAGLDHGARQVLTLEGDAYLALRDRHGDADPTLGAPASDPSTRLLLLFTSGSTGAPKAVVCSTGRFAMLCQVNPLLLGRGEVAYNAMPLFHGNALMASWGITLLHGATFAMRRRFSASGFLDDVQRFGATYVNYVGRSLAYVLAQPERPEEATTSLRLAFGTEASALDRAELRRRYRCEVVENYGSSEGALVVTRTPDTPEGALGVAPPPYVVDVVGDDGDVCPPARLDPDGRLLNPGEAIGELVSRGAAARFEGYWNNPAASADKLRDGDYWTGDLGYRDEDGWIWFAGRTADWLRVDSENFAAAPVERILARLDGVAVAAVYPVPDPRTGDRVMASLQLRDGAVLDPDRLAAFLADAPDLGTKWAPHFVRVTTSLPVTATRKVDKPALRRQAWAGPDLVLERTSAGGYRPVDEARSAALRSELERHGRGDLAPGPAHDDEGSPGTRRPGTSLGS